jgi:hypothetical protein
MEFDERLRRAIDRGNKRHTERAREAAAAALSDEELKQLHSKHRLQLSEHIEQCIQQLPNHFPGFQTESIYGERGWGAACYRDDLKISGGKRETAYSRLELTIRPFSDYHVIDLAGKAAINNKEVFNRNHFEKITEVDTETFLELIDIWITEFAELFAVKK